MSFTVHGLAVSRGIAIGRAVLVASSRADVAHYFIDPAQAQQEVQRIRAARDAVAEEIARLQRDLPKDAPPELAALLDVHLMLLQDEQLSAGVKHWIVERHYNAEWAIATHYEALARQFDEMEDPYLRERKADLEQVVERVLRYLKGAASPMRPTSPAKPRAQQGQLLGDSLDVPLVLIAHDLSPADMLQFKQSLFVGFATDVGGRTSHTAIVARSMDIPAVVGARSAVRLHAGLSSSARYPPLPVWLATHPQPGCTRRRGEHCARGRAAGGHHGAPRQVARAHRTFHSAR